METFENWWPAILTSIALYLLVAYALIINTRDEDMPGGGIPAVVLTSLLWPVLLAIAGVVIACVALMRVVGMFDPTPRAGER